RFPSIDAAVRGAGWDWSRRPIPITPAAHYWMGGVATDLWGRTTVPGLLAVGEVACTGVHGANRLASNSLLEGAVFGHRAASVLAGQAAGAGQVADVPGPAGAAADVPGAAGAAGAARAAHAGGPAGPAGPVRRARPVRRGRRMRRARRVQRARAAAICSTPVTSRRRTRRCPRTGTGRTCSR